MVEDLKLRIKKFNDQNNPLWKMQMEDYLYKKDLYLPWGGNTMKPTSMKEELMQEIERQRLLHAKELVKQKEAHGREMKRQHAEFMN